MLVYSYIDTMLIANSNPAQFWNDMALSVSLVYHMIPVCQFIEGAFSMCSYNIGTIEQFAFLQGYVTDHNCFLESLTNAIHILVDYYPEPSTPIGNLWDHIHYPRSPNTFNWLISPHGNPPVRGSRILSALSEKHGGPVWPR